MKAVPIALACFGLWLVAGRAECADPKTAREYVTRGKEFYGNGKFDEALADFNAAVRLDPPDATAFYQRARAYREKGNLDEAIADNTEAIHLDPKFADAYHNRGLAYYRKGKSDEALADLNTAVRLSPKEPDHYNLRGAIHAGKGQQDEAIADFTAVIRLDPKRAPAYMNRGVIWNNKKEYDRAIRDLDEAVRLNPKDPEALSNRGLAWSDKIAAQNGNRSPLFSKEYTPYDKAIRDFNEAIRLDPKFAQAYTLRAWTYLRTELNNDQAIKDSTEAIRLDPKSALAYLVRGEAGMIPVLRIEAIAKENNVSFKDLLEYAKLTTDKPIADFDRAIRLDPRMAEAYFWRATARGGLGRNWEFEEKWDDAIPDYERCVRLDPTHYRAYVRLGRLYSMKEKHYQALATWAEAVKLNPADKESAEKIKNTTKLVRETWKKPDIKVISIDLDPELKKVVTKKSPPITLAAETEKVVDDTVRVRHSTSITSGWKAEAEVKGKVSAWFVEVETALRGGIEQSTSQTYGVETEKKRSVTIKGTKPVRVVWVDLYRTGKARVALDGREMELPFEFKEDFDLLTEPVSSGPSR